MKGAKSAPEVGRSGRDIILSNGVVQLRLAFRDGGYVQEFSGVDRAGRPRMLLSTIHRNLIPFTEHRVISDPMIVGNRRHLFELSRESVRMAYSEARVTQREEKLSARLSGPAADCTLASTITLYPNSRFARVTVEATLTESRRPPILEYLMAVYAFLPDGMLLDHYRRPDYVWAPSLRPEEHHLIGERSFSTAAVVVQQKTLLAALIPDPTSPRALPVALDLDMRNGLLAAPLVAYGFCKSEQDGPFSRHDRSMLLSASGSLAFSFWLYLDADAPSSLGFEQVQRFIWDLVRDRAPSEPAASAALPECAPTAYVLKSGQRLPGRSNQGAGRIVDDLLARQHSEGVFELDHDQKEPGPYDTVRTSNLCRWLLAIYRDLERDMTLLGACQSYGDFLVANQLPSGAIPSWFSPELEPVAELHESVETAAGGRLLAELYEATGNEQYLGAARWAAKFVTGLVAKQRYRDREALLAGAPGVQDAHTCIGPQGSAGARHAADLFIALYRLTREQRHLKTGLAALAQMCWFQDTWSRQPGVFAAGNAFQAEANHALFGRTLLEYYEVTQRADHLERGIAAVEAGLRAGQPEAQAVRCWAARRFGAAVIDLREPAAYSLGLCRIRHLVVGPGRVSFELENGFDAAVHDPLIVRFRGLRRRFYAVTINGEEKRYQKVELESGIEV